MVCFLQVEFWPGKGTNTALATAHVAAISLLSSITPNTTQPYFALTQAHLQAFSRHMTSVADQFGASRSMDLLPVPAASPRWSAVAAMTAEDVVHQLMGQICERGCHAVQHLWPMIPSHKLLEARLREMMPGKVHVLRRMLRDGPWPGEDAKVMAPLSLPPLPSRQTQSSPVCLDTRVQDLAVASSSGMTAPADKLRKAPSSTPSRHGNASPATPLSRHGDTSSATPRSSDGDLSPATPLSRHDDVSPATPLSYHERAVSHSHTTSHSMLHVTHPPTISSAAPARTSPFQQTDVEPILAPNTSRHVSWDASSDQSSSAQSASGQSSFSQSTSRSMGSSSAADSQTLSDIEAKIAVLTKWGQPLPPSAELLMPESSSRHARRPTPWPRLKKHEIPQSQQLSVSISQADSAPRQQLVTEFPVDVSSTTTRSGRTAAAQAAIQAVLQQKAAQEPKMPSQNALKSTRAASLAQSSPQTPPQYSPTSVPHPQKAPLLSQGKMQPASVSTPDSPSLTQSSPCSPQSSPSLTQSSPALAHGSPQLPHQASQQRSQESQGLYQAGSNPQAQSHLQMWPFVRKYAVPQPLKAAAPGAAPPPPPSPMAGSHTKPAQPSSKDSQVQRQSLAHSSDRQPGPAFLDSFSMASPDGDASQVLRSSTAPASSLSQMLTDLPADSQRPVDSSIQPQTPLTSHTHRRVYSHDACQQQQTEVTAQPEAYIKAGNVAENHTPEWIAQQGSSRDGDALVDGHMWRTPQLPAEWSGQGSSRTNHICCCGCAICCCFQEKWVLASRQL